MGHDTVSCFGCMLKLLVCGGSLEELKGVTSTGMDARCYEIELIN